MTKYLLTFLLSCSYTSQYTICYKRGVVIPCNAFFACYKRGVVNVVVLKLLGVRNTNCVTMTGLSSCKGTRLSICFYICHFSFSLSLTHTHSISLSLLHTHSLFLSLSLTLSLIFFSVSFFMPWQLILPYLIWVLIF